MTRKEFASLPRYANGRIIDLPDVYGKLTDAQIESLHDDDWSYWQELDEEVMHMFHEEFGNHG